MDKLAKAIEQSGQSRYEISRQTGVDQSVLHKIVNGGGCSVQTLEILCEYLGLELVAKKKTKAKKK